MNRITFGLLLVLACVAPAVAQRVEWQARIPGGPGLPGGENRLAACSATGRLYVSGDESCGVRIVEESRMLVTGVLPTPTPVREMFHHDGLCRLFCASATDPELYVIDCNSGHASVTVQLDGSASAWVHASVEDKLYLLTEDGALDVVDPSAMVVTARLEAGGTTWNWTKRLCYADREHAVVCADQSGSRLLSFDCRADTLMGELPLDDVPVAIAYNRANNSVYCVHDWTNDTVEVVDAAVLRVVARIDVPRVENEPLACDPVANKVYCSGASVAVIDGVTNSVVAEVPIEGWHGPIGPSLVVFDSVHRRVCASDVGCFCGSVTGVIDADTDSLLASFLGTAGPNDFCVGPSGEYCWLTGEYEGRQLAYVGSSGELACVLENYTDWGLQSCVVHPATGRLAMAYDWPPGAIVADAASASTLARVSLGAGTSWLAASSTRPLFFALTERFDSSHAWLSVVDAKSLRVLRRHRLPAFGFPYADSMADRLYAVTRRPGGAMLWVFDGEGIGVTDSLALPDDCGWLYTACDGSRLVSVGRENLQVIDVDAMQLVSTVRCESVVEAFCTDARGTRGFFLQENSVGISVLDIETGEVRGCIPLLAVANQMTYDPETDRLYCLMEWDSLVEVRGATATGYHEFIELPLPAQRSFLAAPGVLLFTMDGGVMQYDCRAGELRDAATLDFTPVECLPMGHDSVLLVDTDGNRAALVTLAPRRSGVRPATGDQHQATVVRGVLRMSRPPTADGLRQELMDATGRRVMDLRAGANDVSRLAPGVYFVCQASSVGRDASSVSKVIITR